MIDINNLQVSADKKEILRGLSLQINPGEIHALMGPNGSGKSTLASVVAGSPEYLVKRGAVMMGSFGKSKNNYLPQDDVNVNLLKMTADERAKQGIFLSFQNPPVITGVEVGSFLRQVYLVNQESRKIREKMSLGDFRIWVLDLMKRLALKPEIYNSTLNETMSGGEKKKLEILQMILLRPRFVILDEIDSGLDVDALKIITSEINRYTKENPDASFLIISHYNRIFSYIRPDRVHIMKNGRVVKSGDGRLVEEVERVGYAEF